MSTDARGDGQQHDAHDEGSAGAGAADDVVRLDLPLNHRHASTVRVVAASLAADLGFSVDEIEDLRLGVDEAVSVMADVEASADARLHLSFESADRTITVRVTRTNVPHRLSATDVDGLAVRILQAVVDRFDVGDDGSFIVSKRATGAHVE
jgi:serine/threonine-protein kinase RsbW